MCWVLLRLREMFLLKICSGFNFLVRLHGEYNILVKLSLRIESSAIIHLRGVSTKLNKYILVLPKDKAAAISLEGFYLYGMEKTFVANVGDERPGKRCFLL